MGARLFVAMPVYRGWAYIGEALRSLQAQSFTDFKVHVSVDGADQRTADACADIADDPRFTVILRDTSLGWVRQMNTLIGEADAELFCYFQQDDVLHPDYFARLVAALDENPPAVLAFADLEWFGRKRGVERHDGISGPAIDRMRDYIERLLHTALRGVIRRDAIARAGLIVDEDGGNAQDHVWLTRIVREGDFVRVPHTLYRKRIHDENVHVRWFAQNRRDDRRRPPWVHSAAGLVETMVQMAETPHERWPFVAFVLDRFTRPAPKRWANYEPFDGDPPREFIEAFAAEMIAHIRRRGAADLPTLLDAGWDLIAPRATALVFEVRPVALHDRRMLRAIKRVALTAVGRPPR